MVRQMQEIIKIKVPGTPCGVRCPGQLASVSRASLMKSSLIFHEHSVLLHLSLLSALLF